MLVGDIGGTNARLIMYEASDEQILSIEKDAIAHHKTVSQMYYKNNDFNSFSDVLWQFMNLEKNRNVQVNSCCIAVAGPVANNQINFTNREGWIIDGNSIQEELNIDKVVLINDFVANGYGVSTLSKQEVITLQKGQSNGSHETNGPIALLGAGTGLGECFLTPDSETGEMNVFATEGGHVDFAPRTPLELELLTFLHQKLNTVSSSPSNTNTPSENVGGGSTHQNDINDVPRVSVERLVSGKGLENIYEFLRTKFPDEVNKIHDENYIRSSERGRLIGQEKYNYHLFKKSLEIMFGIYGGEAGNVALKYLPYGGVYIAGGIAPKNLELISSPTSDFMRRFSDKGRMSSIMTNFPLYIVLKEDLGLRGAHAVASCLCKKMIGTTSIVNSKNVTVVQRQTFGENVFEAIQRYPLTYAALMSTTAALTAGTIVVMQLYLLRRR